MRRHFTATLTLPALLLGTTVSCAPIHADAGASAAPTIEPAATRAAPPPMREPFTTYLQVLRDGKRIGYAVRYDAVPEWVDGVERSFPAGALLFEDRRFRRVGFFVNGRLFGFDGEEPELLAEGPVEETLPALFGEGNYALAPNA